MFWSTKVFWVVLSDTVFSSTSAKHFSEVNFHVKSLLNHQQHCLFQCRYLSAPLGAYKINKGIFWRVLKVAGAEAVPYSLSLQWHFCANLQRNKRQAIHRIKCREQERKVWANRGPLERRCFGGRGSCGQGAIAFQLSGCSHSGCQNRIFKLQMLTELFWFLNESERRVEMKMYVSVSTPVTACIYACMRIRTHMCSCI